MRAASRKEWCHSHQHFFPKQSINRSYPTLNCIISSLPHLCQLGAKSKKDVLGVLSGALSYPDSGTKLYCQHNSEFEIPQVDLIKKYNYAPRKQPFVTALQWMQERLQLLLCSCGQKFSSVFFSFLFDKIEQFATGLFKQGCFCKEIINGCYYFRLYLYDCELVLQSYKPLFFFIYFLSISNLLMNFSLQSFVWFISFGQSVECQNWR